MKNFIAVTLVRLSFRVKLFPFIFARRYHRIISRFVYNLRESHCKSNQVRLPFDTTSHVKTMGVLRGDHIWASSTKAKIAQPYLFSLPPLPFTPFPLSRSGCNIYVYMLDIYVYESPMSLLYIEMMTVKPRYGHVINISRDLARLCTATIRSCPHFKTLVLLSLTDFSPDFSQSCRNFRIYLFFSPLFFQADFSRWFLMKPIYGRKDVQLEKLKCLNCLK